MLQVIITDMPFEYINKDCMELLSVRLWATCQKQTSPSSAFYFKSKTKLIPPNSKHPTEVPKAED